ncbi:MAG: hypothetical protein COU85_01690 [Candidatus Portnoybacteria bacterium CG10_big_fil_rev_8_21_14_0_10_44_7]|uniref:R3H domain-containing protein n=1 Tax=Candidatus Portnoybacteria bacterium CG10_big_fil_rev_8_21_14_0_10_44_7 TaxID=1974816 RepID=A0A2M8KIR2_9BACT|nr:MAG: hypothetical protein COU85_01690 [Candidatus Portnoybacteria bacterium CG10_big_fil_rev_8_21_14_0_10_44_7]
MERAQIKQTIEEVLNKAGFVGDATIDAQGDVWRVAIKTPEASHLIGQGGQNLLAWQQIFQQLLIKKLGGRAKLVLDINDYRKNKEAAIIFQAQEAAKRAKMEKRVVALPPMNAYERRLVHTQLATDAEVETNSEGEGEQRKVLIKPKSEFS